MVVMMMMGCASSPPAENTRREPSRFLSLSPADLGHSLSQSQVVTGYHDGQEYKMRFELEITPSRLVVVGLSPIGVTLFTIVQEDGDLSVESSLERQLVFDPRHMLFDIYLTYWPVKALQTALSKLGLQLEETDDGRIRRIRGLDGTDIAEIKYSSKPVTTGNITIQHYDFPYRLSIKTLEARGAR
jgi:hypothetical protein